MVRSGLDRAARSLFAGRRIGLVTNPTGVNRALQPTAVALTAVGATVAAIFGPEHGYTGVADAGEWVEDACDPATGAPVYSLYRTGADGAPVYAPPPGSLDGLDALVFDIQDVGARYYTYPTTLGLLLEQSSVPIIVLDRPNPLGGLEVEGPTLAPDVVSFVGRYPTPVRHGLTLGEWATWVNDGVPGGRAKLAVVEMEGWRREMRWGQTGLPWVPPSPNLPTPDAALVYPGTCLAEGTNLSCGRGTTRPFELVGAPWLDPTAFAAALNALDLPGLRFRPTYFRPLADRFVGDVCGGVQLYPTRMGARRLLPGSVRAGLAIIAVALRLGGEHFAWLPAHFDRLIGSDAPRLLLNTSGGDPAALPPLFAQWEADEAAFRAARAPYLRYPHIPAAPRVMQGLNSFDQGHT